MWMYNYYEDVGVCLSVCRDSQLLGTGHLSRKLTVHRVPESDELHIHYLSIEYGELNTSNISSIACIQLDSLNFQEIYPIWCTPTTSSGLIHNTVGSIWSGIS